MSRVFFLVLCSALLARANLSDAARKQIDAATGARGVYTAAEDVHKVSFPRRDVAVSVDGWKMHPFMGLTSWAAFTSATHQEATVMGDLVLFEDEVNPVLSAALGNGLEVTALHNHFFFDQPRVMFMHIGGEGPAADLARAVRKCLDKVRQIRAASSTPAAAFSGAETPAGSSITAAAIDRILGVKGQSNAGMYKAVIGRKAMMHEREVGKEMGVSTWAAFAGTDGDALVDGDFAMLANELQGVLKTLRSAGINIVAIHNHMTQEEPHYVFLHFWGKGRAADLARGVRKALDTQADARTHHLGHQRH
ncbi:MAG: DUF1259 domain-containing protein [Acidobacteria bacterium]|nr:DUF1259 domain-containing protein [Acidobacteriota bacterium]